jgi:F-type H+-transporting ATPase subunit b
MQDLLKSLNFNTTIFLMQVVLFIALWIAMNHLFWKPMLKHLGNRDQSIKDAYKSVEDTRHEMERLRSDYQVRITQIEADARARIQTAIREAQSERERLLAEAREQADAAIKKGVADMEREKNEALASLHERMTGLALNAVAKALGSVGDPATLRRSIEEHIAASAPNVGNPARN